MSNFQRRPVLRPRVVAGEERNHDETLHGRRQVLSDHLGELVRLALEDSSGLAFDLLVVLELDREDAGHLDATVPRHPKWPSGSARSVAKTFSHLARCHPSGPAVASRSPATHDAIGCSLSARTVVPCGTVPADPSMPGSTAKVRNQLLILGPEEARRSSSLDTFAPEEHVQPPLSVFDRPASSLLKARVRRA